MQDDLAVIRRARLEHESIRSTITLLAEHTSSIDDEYYRERWLRRHVASRGQSPEMAFTDKDALYRLALVNSDLLSDDLQKAALSQLAVDLQALAQGLESHFTNEEQDVTGVFTRHGSEILVTGLFAEHGFIRQAIADALDMARSEVWQSSDHQAHITLGRELSRTIERIRLTIEQHAQREEILFEQTERALVKALESEH